MSRFWKWGIGAIVVLALAGAAGRLVMAQSGDETPADDTDKPNFIARLAENLGITEDTLQAAVQETQLEILDEAVAAGRIDEERAAEIRERIESGEGFGFGFPGGRGHHHRGHLALGEVAEFLGVDESVIVTGLEEGQTLGEIAAANGSSPEALVDHLVSQLEERVNEKVAEEDITQERADEILENARERITDMVNREPGDFPRFRDGLPDDMPSPDAPPEGAGLPF